MGAFDATGTPAVRAEQALKSYAQTVCISNAATDFAGTWSPGANHMGLTNGVSAIACPAGKSIVILEVTASVTGAATAATAYSYTLAEQDSDDDIIRMSVNGGTTGLWEGPVKLTVGKDLEYYKGQAFTGTVATLVISYIIV